MAVIRHNAYQVVVAEWAAFCLLADAATELTFKMLALAKSVQQGREQKQVFKWLEVSGNV